MRRLFVLLMLSCCLVLGESKQPNLNGHYLATAYSQRGQTTSGVLAQQHIVAADPDILPLGSKIKIRGIGRYSGEYVVGDTGEKIVGRHLDIYIPNARVCRKFGRKRVRVKVLSLGDNTHSTTVQAVQQVKQDVKDDLNKNAVGNAATEADWAAHQRTANPAAAAPPSAHSSSNSTGQAVQ